MQNNSDIGGPWFNIRALEHLVDPGIWANGMMLYLTQKVLRLEIDSMPDCWLLIGEVQGQRRRAHEVSIELTLTPDGQVSGLDSDCDCIAGHPCQHGVALLFKAAQQGRRLIGGAAADRSSNKRPSAEQVEADRQAAKARAEAMARMEAETQLLGWLQKLDRSTGLPPPASPMTPSARAAPVRHRAEQYLYLLSVTGATSAKPQLQIEAVLSYPKVTGGWAKPKALRMLPYRGLAVFDQATPTDREVLQLIAAMSSSGSSYARYGYNYNSRVSGALEGRAGLIALEQAASTGRLFVHHTESGFGPAIRWGPPRSLHWEWQEVSSARTPEPGWVLRARLEEGQAILCLNNPPLYFDPVHGLCGPVQADGIQTAQLEVLLSAPQLKPSALQKHQVELMQRLGSVPAPPVLQPLATLTGIVPTACLHLSPVPAADIPQHGLVHAQLGFDYQGHRGWWAGQGSTVLIDGPPARCLLHRDTEAELDAITRLAALGLRSFDKGRFGIPADASQQDWLVWADAGFSVFRDAGFELTLDQALRGWITRADTLDVQLQPQGEEDEGATSPWFDLSLGMEINGRRHNILPWLPALIAQLGNRAPDPQSGLSDIPAFIYLPASDGTGFVRLPTDVLKPWMAALLELVGDRSHDFSGDSLKLSRLDAMRTTASLGEGAVWQGAQALRDLLRQLRGKTALPEVPVPGSVQATLRPYQQHGLSWLQFLREHGLAGILADDMGLGKTLQTLAHIQVEKDAGRLTRPALIIAPVSLMGNWRREAERFCPQLRSLVIHGKDRHDVARTMDQHDIVIAPYSLLQRDRERWLEAKWHLVVLDEAQNIKNASTHAAQVVGQLQTRHRLCLSGTPMENHLGEIWSLFHFLMPGFLGSQRRFAELFRTPIEKQGNAERLTQLRSRITPFMLRRTKTVVATELPPKVETVMRVELSGAQADLYETIRLGMEKAVREALSAKGLAKSHITILDALLKLRQVCCHPQLLSLAAAKRQGGRTGSGPAAGRYRDSLRPLVEPGRREPGH